MAIDDKVKKAVLVGIQTPKVGKEEFESSLAELARLVTTLGYEVEGQVVQKRSSTKLSAVLGEGKLKELAEWTGGPGIISKGVEHKLTKAALKWQEEEEELEEELDEPEDLDSEDLDDDNQVIEPKSAQIVIVDTDLSPSQLRNLESAAGVMVLDRTGVIIEIFSRHAHTRAARLQVKIAKLTYLAPRLRETGNTGDRQGGGIGSKGAGESKLELDKRKVRDSIKKLKAELATIGSEHDVRRARREKEPCVALVGYTNAGKSSLMRAITGSDVLVEDKLFATLDTTIRPLYPVTQPKILVSDTVGFIKKLPHDLVASFKSTLDEALNASLLLFVIDASDPAYKSQLEVTQSVLSEVGATDVPRLTILNKKDRLSEDDKVRLMEEFPEAIMLSALNKDDLKMLRGEILTYFEEDMIDDDIFVPFLVKGIVGEIRSKMRVLDESYDEKGVTFTVRSKSELIFKIKSKILQSKK